MLWVIRPRLTIIRGQPSRHPNIARIVVESVPGRTCAYEHWRMICHVSSTPSLQKVWLIPPVFFFSGSPLPLISMCSLLVLQPELPTSSCFSSPGVDQLMGYQQRSHSSKPRIPKSGFQRSSRQAVRIGEIFFARQLQRNGV